MTPDDFFVDERREWRREVIEAIGTFPRWPHARIGLPAFAAKVKVPELRVAAERYAPARGNLTLLGPTGAGKTTAAVAIADRHVLAMLEVVRRAEDRTHWASAEPWRLLRSAYFIRAAELVRAMRSHPLGHGDAPEVVRAMRASWLVIDDLANEPVGHESAFLDLVDERYVHQRPTCITSGFRLGQVEGRYSAAFLRRLVEPTGAVIDGWEAMP